MTTSRHTCLVVDDDESLRDALRKILELAGYYCVMAASGEEALAELEQDGIPIVLTDIRMPGMDGVALLQRIRERWPDVAVVMVTAVTDVHVAVSCLQMGALDYIMKPYELQEVRARIEQALDKQRLIQENRRYQNHLAELVQLQACRIEELFLEGIQALVTALEAKDAYTRGHSTRVSAYAGRVAAELGMSDTDVQLVGLGAELHDVGKIGVREQILLKPAALTDDEYQHLMKHTLIGARILEPLLKNAPQVLAVVRSHHERVDGGGLPDGLSGQAIPFFARIVSLADAFDAMTSARPYRPAMAPVDAVAEITRCKNSQFDPDVANAFLQAYDDLTALPIETPAKVRRKLPGSLAAGDVVSSVL
ncbi:MAG: HD domain-containing phosphohydrolase [Gemmatimonadales bacterium]